MYKYEIIIYWSKEDEAFIAEVTELPGCVAHGDTPDSALRNANDAIQLWIDTAKEFGDFIPEPKGEGEDHGKPIQTRTGTSSDRPKRGRAEHTLGPELPVPGSACRLGGKKGRILNIKSLALCDYLSFNG